MSLGGSMAPQRVGYRGVFARIGSTQHALRPNFEAL
jgi:hypothetical protein